MNSHPSCPSTQEPSSRNLDEVEKANVKIRISVFFDGTRNNRINSIAHQLFKLTESKNPTNQLSQKFFNPLSPEDSEIKQALDYYLSKLPVNNEKLSFHNDLTNVARLYEDMECQTTSGFDRHEKVYIAGIGTATGADDELLGYAFGADNTGIESRVKTAMDRVTAMLRSILTEHRAKNMTIEIHLDAFGFSRGAAAARNFIDVALFKQAPHAYHRSMRGTPQKLESIEDNLKKEYELKNAPIFDFVGLFDTVASYGLLSTGMEWSNTFELQLDSIKSDKVKKVVHFCAADEHRTNFALTNIKSVLGNSNSEQTKGLEVYFPGVHSDIGGSYHDRKSQDNILYSKIKVSHTEVSGDISASREQFKLARESLKKEASNLIGSGWLIESSDKYDVSGPGLVLHRLGKNGEGIRNTYSLVIMGLMKDQYLQHTKYTVNFKKHELTKNIPLELLPIKKMLEEYIQNVGNKSKPEDWTDQNDDQIRHLRGSYLHLSSNYTPTQLFGVDTIADNKPRFEDDKRIRKYHDG